ncbi:acyl-CoA dehydrogenase, partial [Arthrobacter deserti]|nr:acyl-CoA dehydrogenase [Arthrobacter deserti]
AGQGLNPRSYAGFGPLAPHLRFVGRSSRRLARNTFAGMARWQAGLEHRQVFLGRIVDIGAELFAMAACCSRAELLAKQDPARGRSARELAGAFCRQSRERVRQLSDDLWHNTDAGDRRLAGKGLDGDHTWLETGIIDISEGTGPWIAEPSPGPSQHKNQRRSYR